MSRRVLAHIIFLNRLIKLLIVVSFVLGVSGCQMQRVSETRDRMLVVATNSLVGDVVSQVGGDKVSVEVLLPIGTDPHSFSPTPRDGSKIADAAIVFENGAGLEKFLNPLIENVGGTDKVVEVSRGIKFRTMVDEESGNNQPVDDPHTWMVPNNVITWVDNIVRALSERDQENAGYYQARGKAYQDKLQQLDTWIRNEVASIPEQNRMIVTEHLIFGYFSDRYGFTQVGAIVPGFSSLAEPSARDLAQIEDSIRQMGVKAIFLNKGVYDNIAQRIADDTGTRLVFLYMESLSDQGKEADTYINFMTYDVSQIIAALK